MNANIMKTYISHKMRYELKGHFYVIERSRDFFLFRPSTINLILTYVLIDNFCPCFIIDRMNIKISITIRTLGRYLTFVRGLSLLMICIHIIGINLVQH